MFGLFSKVTSDEVLVINGFAQSIDIVKYNGDKYNYTKSAMQMNEL